MSKSKKTVWIILIAIAAAVILFFAIFLGLRLSSRPAADEKHAFPVYINEVLSSNGSYPNRDGICCDYIELYNSSDAAIDLEGYQLGDKEGGDRYRFPDGTVLEAHGYLCVFCSKEHSGAFYADFGLSRHGGEDVYFLNPQSVVLETVTVLAADKDVAQGLDDRLNWTVLPFATPGFANTQEGYRLWTEQQANILPSDVLISEIMTSNTIYRTADGDCSDWIELWNRSSADLSLAGYGLSDSLNDPIYYFPQDTVIASGAYLVVPCALSGDNAAHFKLSKAGGEDVTLFDRNGAIADTVPTVPCAQNQSYARTENGSFALTFDATPGFANTEEGRAAYIRSAGFDDVSVHITELMADNKSILADADGRFYDWIELTNTGKKACTLTGWYLSDDENDLTQWKLPDCTIEAGESRVILFAGNRDGESNGMLYAPMSLSAAGETVYLVTPFAEIAEQVAFGATDENRSLVIDPETGEQRVSENPTPGFADTDEGYEAFSQTLNPRGALAIWEVMTANDRYLSQSGEYYDWVELRNVSSEPIDLSAYSISDDSKSPDRFSLPAVTLNPGKTYVVILSGHTEYSNKHYVHAPFALNAQEDSLFVFENGALCDYVHLHGIPYRCTLGRTDGQGGFFYMSPTPGEPNAAGNRMISADPTASLSPGVYAGATGLDITLEANGTIYYTTDCSMPNKKAKKYTGPIHLGKSTVIRAISYESGKKASSVATFSYLLDAEHDLPVVSLVTAPENLWDPEKGIYVDSTHRKEIEIRGSVAYYGEDGEWAQECGIKMHGVTSLKQDKKSFTVKFSGVYGGPLRYDVFGDGEVNVFKSLILRADYESTYASFIRDNMLHRIAKLYSPTLMAQNYRYVVLYLNGEYWGIYALREQYTPFFYASNMGVPEDTVTISKNRISGGTSLNDVLRYVTAHNMKEPEHYAYVTERVDISSLIDWAIFESYCGNFDIYGNTRYLYSTEDGKWRCGLVDVDLGFFRANAFSYVLEANQIGTILKKLFRNAAFREQLLTRLSELLSTGLSEQNVTAMIDEMAAEIRSEIPREKKKWGGTARGWENEVASLKKYIPGRSQKVIKSIQKEMNLSDSVIQQYFGKLLT